MLVTQNNGAGIIQKIGSILTEEFGFAITDIQRATINLYNTPNFRGLGIEFIVGVRGKVHKHIVWTDSDEPEYFRNSVMELGAWMKLVKEANRGNNNEDTGSAA